MGWSLQWSQGRRAAHRPGVGALLGPGSVREGLKIATSMSVLFAAQQLAGAALPRLTPLEGLKAGAETKSTWWLTWWLGEKVYSNPTVTTT